MKGTILSIEWKNAHTEPENSPRVLAEFYYPERVTNIPDEVLEFFKKHAKNGYGIFWREFKIFDENSFVNRVKVQSIRRLKSQCTDTESQIPYDPEVIEKKVSVLRRHNQKMLDLATSGKRIYINVE